MRRGTGFIISHEILLTRVYENKGAVIGAAVGIALGSIAGVLIGKKIEKQKAELEKIEGATVENENLLLYPGFFHCLHFPFGAHSWKDGSDG